VSSVYKDTVSVVCETVTARLYEQPVGFKKWSAECLQLANQVSAFRNKTHVVDLLSNKMAELELSHLGIYAPAQTKVLWTGESKDTGLRGRFIESQYVIFQVLKGSPAEKAGVKVGDSLATVNDKSVASQWQVQKTIGEFVFLRKGEPKKVKLTPEAIQIDEAPSVSKLSQDTGLLRVSSFRKELFDRENWRRLAKQGLQQYKKLVIDLRENPGGSFVAMLRALSPFFCQPQSAGYIIKPRLVDHHSTVIRSLPDDASDLFQVEIFTKHSLINLETYSDYGCFEGQVVVLIDQETASVAEIFAEALKYRGKTQVLGRVSSGDVLLGVWYDLAIIGKDYSFSVPEALYQNPEGKTLERVGVPPDFEVEYKLMEALEGKDSYLEAALSVLRGAK
jgi:carboxyl-terminal processing protease